MKIHRLEGEKAKNLQSQLENFESQFQYPLGEQESFSISHAKDYRCFYRSMGEAICLAAELEEKIVGSFSASLRPLKLKNREKPLLTAYLGDLKVDLQRQKTGISYHLLHAMQKALNVELGFAVVMDGTKTTPSQYTGRLDIPQFNSICKYYILCFQTNSNFTVNENFSFLSEEEGFKIFQDLTHKDYFLQSNSLMRSKSEPKWLNSNENKACAKFEDTEKAKQLFTSTGKLLRAAHLSYFAFTDSRFAYNLLLQALQLSKNLEFPQLFVAFNDAEFSLIAPFLNELKFDISTATLFSNDQTNKYNLQINTAEI